jgi:peptidoglycan/xylan/chitin deacetylase (PgdA/CDA1 family)
MRIDRCITLNVLSRIADNNLDKNNNCVRILMYHSICCDAENSVTPYYRLNTSPEIFDMQMMYIRRNNYKVIPLDEVQSIFTNNQESDVNYIAITFDDGFLDFYDNAYPILNKYNMPSTVFLPTDYIGSPAHKIKGKKHLDWDQIRFLRDEGVTFGSHTMSHKQMKNLASEEMEYEIVKSKEIIEQKLQVDIDAFSYPYAFPDADAGFKEQLASCLQRNGYKTGVSTRVGTATVTDDIYYLKRLPVNDCDDMDLFGAKLRGYYDWFYYLQVASKYLKSYTGTDHE